MSPIRRAQSLEAVALEALHALLGHVELVRHLSGRARMRLAEARAQDQDAPLVGGELVEAAAELVQRVPDALALAALPTNDLLVILTRCSGGSAGEAGRNRCGTGRRAAA